MVMDVQFDEVFEHVMMNAIIAAGEQNGVVDGLAVSENGAGASMHVDVAAGNAWIDRTKYTEAAITENVAIMAAHATLPRKDLVTYDASGSIPAVVTGTAAATPEPQDIPAGDILLAIVDVAAAVTQITNADITDGRVVIRHAMELIALTEILYTYTGDIITNIKLRYTDGHYENIDYDYWNSGDGNLTINGHVYSYAAGIDGRIRQGVHLLQDDESSPTWTKTVTTRYGYNGSFNIERIGRTVV